MCEDNHLFVPINNSNVNPGIDAHDNENNDDKNEEDKDEADMNNNHSNLDDEDGGIIMNDVNIEYDEFNIPITVVHLIMGGKHAAFGFINSLLGNSNKSGRSWSLFVFYVTRHWMAPIMIRVHG